MLYLDYESGNRDVCLYWFASYKISTLLREVHKPRIANQEKATHIAVSGLYVAHQIKKNENWNLVIILF